MIQKCDTISYFITIRHKKQRTHAVWGENSCCSFWSRQTDLNGSKGDRSLLHQCLRHRRQSHRTGSRRPLPVRSPLPRWFWLWEWRQEFRHNNRRMFCATRNKLGAALFLDPAVVASMCGLTHRALAALRRLSNCEPLLRYTWGWHLLCYPGTERWAHEKVRVWRFTVKQKQVKKFFPHKDWDSTVFYWF